MFTAIDKESDFSGISKIKVAPDSVPVYPDTTGMPEHEVSMMKVKFERETKQIRREFSRLLLKVQKSLEKTTSLDTVVILLKEFDDEGWLDKCLSLAQVFQNHKKFCSFYDTSMIKVFVDDLGTDDDKRAYKEYKEKFQRYCAIPIFKFPSGSYSDEDGSEEIGMKMDSTMEKLEKEQKQEVQYEMNRAIKATKTMRLLSDEQTQHPNLSSLDSVTSASSTSSELNKEASSNAANKNDNSDNFSGNSICTSFLDNEISSSIFSEAASSTNICQEADGITVSSKNDMTEEIDCEIIIDSKEMETISIAEVSEKYKVSILNKL